MKTKLLAILFFSSLLVACDNTKDVNKNKIEPLPPISTLEIDNSAGISKYYKTEGSTPNITTENAYIDNTNYVWNDTKFTIDDKTYELGITTLNDLLNDNFIVSDSNLSVSSNGTTHSISENNLINDDYNFIRLENKDKYNKNTDYILSIWFSNNNILDKTVDSIIIDASGNSNRKLDNLPYISISCGVKVGDTVDEIKSVYGEPNYSYTVDSRTVLNYETKDNDYNLILYVHYLDGLNRIEIYRGHYDY